MKFASNSPGGGLAGFINLPLRGVFAALLPLLSGLRHPWREPLLALWEGGVLNHWTKGHRVGH